MLLLSPCLSPHFPLPKLPTSVKVRICVSVGGWRRWGWAHTSKEMHLRGFGERESFVPRVSRANMTPALRYAAHLCGQRGGGAWEPCTLGRDYHPPFFSRNRVSTAPLFWLTPPKGVHACDDLSVGIRIKEREGETDR